MGKVRPCLPEATASKEPDEDPNPGLNPESVFLPLQFPAPPMASLQPGYINCIMIHLFI